MDGDNLSTSTFGYLFATVTAPVADVFKNNCKFPIMHGIDCIGYVYVESLLDVASEVLNVRQFDKYEKYQTGFFDHSIPTDKVVRDEYDKFDIPFGQYILEINTKDICHITDEHYVDGETFVQVRLSLNVTFTEEEDKEAPVEHDDNGEPIVKTIKKTIYLPVPSSNLLTIWESIPNYTRPFKVSAAALKFSHTELTLKDDVMGIVTAATEGTLDSTFPHELKLVFEVFVGGTESANAPPIRVGYCVYSVWKLLMATKHPEKTEEGYVEQMGAWSKPLKRHVLQTHDFDSQTKQMSSDEEGKSDKGDDDDGSDDDENGSADASKKGGGGGGLFSRLLGGGNNKKKLANMDEETKDATDKDADASVTSISSSRKGDEAGQEDSKIKKGGLFGFLKRPAKGGDDKKPEGSVKGSDAGSVKGSVKGSEKGSKAGSEGQGEEKKGGLFSRFFKKKDDDDDMSPEMRELKKELDEVCT
jgi:hypothetical protein